MKRVIVFLLTAMLLTACGLRHDYVEGTSRIGAFLPPDQDADEIMYLKML